MPASTRSRDCSSSGSRTYCLILTTYDDEDAALTEREGEVLDLIAGGPTNRQIGERLFLAEKTVKNYVSSLLAKLGMQRRTQAAVFGAEVRKD
jgi:two-component system response regulator DevR